MGIGSINITISLIHNWNLIVPLVYFRRVSLYCTFCYKYRPLTLALPPLSICISGYKCITISFLRGNEQQISHFETAHLCSCNILHIVQHCSSPSQPIPWLPAALSVTFNWFFSPFCSVRWRRRWMCLGVRFANPVAMGLPSLIKSEL